MCAFGAQINLLQPSHNTIYNCCNTIARPNRQILIETVASKSTATATATTVTVNLSTISLSSGPNVAENLNQKPEKKTKGKTKQEKKIENKI